MTLDHPWQVIKDLEDHNLRTNKEQIIQAQIDASNREFFDGVSMALSPYVTFGVKKVPQHGGPDGQGLPWVAFCELAHLLQSRQLTGNEARSAIELALSASTQDQWNFWYRRILIKDLRCGVSEKTVNKVVKGTDVPAVPVFECMLAHDGANHEKKIQGVKLLEPKLDGVRCLTVVDFESRTVTQYTRNGKVLENFSHITEALKSQLDFFGRSYVLDGEVVSSSFQNLMTQVHRKSDVQAQDARLMLFDIVPLSEFKQGRSITGQRRRSALLRSLRSAFAATGCVELVSQVEVDLDTMIGQAQFKEFNQQAIIDNYEGIMIKDPNAAYECKRSASWLKMKPFIEVSLTINTVEEGTGRNLGKLGALVCSGNDDGRMIDVNVGSGFTDEQRAEFWEDREVLVNQVVEVRADAVTQNQDGSYSLRFPRFLRFRGFAAGEKI